MYTELIVGCALKSDVPAHVIETLKYMVDDREDLPKDTTLKIGRNPLKAQSYYFAVCQSSPKFWYEDLTKAWVLSARGNIKNYGGEIEEFLEWLKPFISSGSGRDDFYAITIYEESRVPTIHYLHDA